MTILGDLWVTVEEITKAGSVITSFQNDEKTLFHPRLHMGEWAWWTSDHYLLRANGPFNEYDN